MSNAALPSGVNTLDIEALHYSQCSAIFSNVSSRPQNLAQQYHNMPEHSPQNAAQQITQTKTSPPPANGSPT
jgi:hypothetical protein